MRIYGRRYLDQEGEVKKLSEEYFKAMEKSSMYKEMAVMFIFEYYVLI